MFHSAVGCAFKINLNLTQQIILTGIVTSDCGEQNDLSRNNLSEEPLVARREGKSGVEFHRCLQQQPKHTDVHLVDGQNSSLLAVFEKAGLVGCLATDEQLSTNYKTVLDYSQKHSS